MDLIEREKALGCFWNYANDDGTGFDETDMPAYDRLQALPIVAEVEDCISRQAAIDELLQLVQDRYSWQKDASEQVRGINAAICAIEELPSAQPEPIKLHVDHALTEEEIKNLKQKIADAPIVLMPYEKPKVIHCKDCRYYEWMSNRVPEEQTWYCHNWNAETGKDDYCSYAERRQE